MMRTLSQRRAEFAWKEANEGANQAGYVSMVKGASAFIMANGLMQALAYYASRGKKNEAQAKLLLSSICEWLVKSQVIKLPAGSNVSDPFRAVMDAFVQKEMRSIQYMRATGETLEMLRWLRQFADALKPKDAQESQVAGGSR